MKQLGWMVVSLICLLAVVYFGGKTVVMAFGMAVGGASFGDVLKNLCISAILIAGAVVAVTLAGFKRGK